MTTTPQLRASLVYVVLACAWIGFSDHALEAMLRGSNLLVLAMTIKGFVFVAGTGLMLYWVLGRGLKSLLAANHSLRGDNERVMRVLLAAMKLSRKDAGCSSDRMVPMVEGLAKVAGLSGDALREIKVGALLRDVGNLAIAEAGPATQTRLSTKQMAQIRRHTQTGRDLLEQADFPATVVDVAHAHHERWDGFGYPRGLAGEAIPLAARIVSIVDVWDALSSDRGYRQKWPESKVLEYMHNGAGSQFDPELTSLFIAHYEQLKGAAKTAHKPGTSTEVPSLRVAEAKAA
jgi:HD-GYP domain-containing protein (c-di-GMP phosphodiesterase class II)